MKMNKKKKDRNDMDEWKLYGKRRGEIFNII